jgi:hypothetical protein
MKKFFLNVNYRRTTLGILIFVFILIYSIGQANYSVQINNFSLSLVYYDGSKYAGQSKVFYKKITL